MHSATTSDSRRMTLTLERKYATRARPPRAQTPYARTLHARMDIARVPCAQTPHARIPCVQTPHARAPHARTHATRHTPHTTRHTTRTHTTRMQRDAITGSIDAAYRGRCRCEPSTHASNKAAPGRAARRRVWVASFPWLASESGGAHVPPCWRWLHGCERVRRGACTSVLAVVAWVRASQAGRMYLRVGGGCMGVLVSRCSLWALCSMLGVGGHGRTSETHERKVEEARLTVAWWYQCSRMTGDLRSSSLTRLGSDICGIRDPVHMRGI